MRYLREAEEYLTKGDPVQSSEKLCKVAEECIKALAVKFQVSQLNEVRKKGRWDTWLLGKAATELSRKLNEKMISLAWSKAYEIHVWGFHEARYGIEEVEEALHIIRWLLEHTAKKVLNEENSSPMQEA